MGTLEARHSLAVNTDKKPGYGAADVAGKTPFWNAVPVHEGLLLSDIRREYETTSADKQEPLWAK
ncbi:MAG: hypothetical protein AAB466_13355 [Verrucomicrobiota bacterium]